MNMFWVYHEEKFGKKEGTFICGEKIAKKILKELQLPRLPMFNPYKERKTSKKNKKEYVYFFKKKWNPEMYQLFVALNIVIIY